MQKRAFGVEGQYTMFGINPVIIFYCFIGLLALWAISFSAVSKPLIQVPQGMKVAYLVVDISSGKVIDAKSPNDLMIPASTSKIATALFALDHLGLEYRFATEVLIHGNVSQGVLQGDLILRGGGDSSLDIPDIFKLALALQRHGIKKVNGRFIVDDSILPRFTHISTDVPLEAAYNPGIGALSLSHNRVQLQWRNQKVSAVPGLDEAEYHWLSPKKFDVGSVALNTNTPNKNGVKWNLAHRPNKRISAQVPVKDSGLHVGYLFRQLAEKLSIDLPPPNRARWAGGQTSMGIKQLAVHHSPPNETLLRNMLIYSNNMMAETLGLMSLLEQRNISRGKRRPEEKLLETLSDLPSTPKPLSPNAKGLMETLEPFIVYLKSLDKQQDWEGMVLENFSGLSPNARLSPAQLVSLLKYGWQQGELMSLLPTSGWTGSLRRRMSDNENRFRVWAKTGSINYGSALSGYLLAKSGRFYGFAIMTTDFKARSAYSNATKRTAAGEGRARRWNRRAKEVQNAMVQYWLTL